VHIKNKEAPQIILEGLDYWEMEEIMDSNVVIESSFDARYIYEVSEAKYLELLQR
jgi:hypothetical protein